VYRDQTAPEAPAIAFTGCSRTLSTQPAYNGIPLCLFIIYTLKFATMFWLDFEQDL
jgi:hypothetical protein